MAITTTSFLTKGSQIEVSSHVSNSNDGAWYSATVIHPPPSTHTTTNSLVYVEYHNLMSEDGSNDRMREYANAAYVRPAPVHHARPVTFQVSDRVDAFYKDGWWSGVVSSVVDEENYVVAFENPSVEVRFRREELRVHMEWIGGRWIEYNKKDDTASRTTKTEIEQATPVTDKESPTSVMKRKRQDLGSNDKASPSGDVMKVDSSKKKKHQSNGQSKVVDSAVSGTTDQDASKTEDLTNGKKVGGTDVRTTHSLIGKQPHPFIPTIILKKHKTTPSDEFMNGDSSKKKMPTSAGQSEGFDSEVNGMIDQASSKTENLSHEKKAGDTAVGTTDSLIDNNQIEQTTPTIGKQSPVATPIVEGKTQKNVDSNGETSPSDKIVNADSSTKKKQVSDGQSENLDSEVSEMTDQEKRERNTEKKASTKGSKRKKGELSKELKSLQASTKGSEVDLLRTRTQELVGKKDATKNLPLILDSQCNAMAVSEGKMVQKPLGEKTSNVDETDTNQPDSPLAPLTVADQEGSEGDAASVALKRKTKKNSRKGKRVKRRAISDINTESPAQVSVVSEDASKEKADGSLEKDLTTNPEASVGKSLDTVPADLPILKRCEGNNSPATISNQNASKEKPDVSLEKDSTTNPEASVGKSLDTVPVDKPILKRCQGNHSPVAISNQQLNLSVEGTVEETTSRASVGPLDLGNLPFIRSMALWKTLESMEAFRKLPQKPHFRPLLDGVKEGAREGLAIAAMVNFATTFDQACSLKIDDPRSVIEDCLETLVELEDNGFTVEVLRQRLTSFRSIKGNHEIFVEQSKGIAEEVEERKIQDKIIEAEIEEINRQIKELEELKTSALVKKEKIISELDAMEGIKQVMKEIGAEFDNLTKAPYV